MGRQQIAIGGMFALMVAFFAGLNRFEGSRAAQSIVAAGYVIAMVALMGWANRRIAR